MGGLNLNEFAPKQNLVQLCIASASGGSGLCKRAQEFGSEFHIVSSTSLGAMRYDVAEAMQSHSGSARGTANVGKGNVLS